MPRENDTVSFRLSSTFLDQLGQRTETLNEGRRNKLSRHDVARKLLVDVLTDTQAHRYDELQTQVADLRRSVAALRDDLATILLAVLTRTEPLSAADAKRMVKEAFLSRR